MRELESVLKALADQTRLRILNILAVKKACVCELSRVLKISGPSVSRHLKKLGDAGLVESEQEGFWTNYFLKMPDKPARNLICCIAGALSGYQELKKDVNTIRVIGRKKCCLKKRRNK